MKVKIGKYPNRLICRIHTRYMDWKYGCVRWPVELTRFERFLEQLEDAVQTVYNLVNIPFLDEREQSVKVKIDSWDTWSMDHTLAHIVLPMLVQLKQTKHGAPNVDPEDVPEELRPDGEWKKAYEGDGTTDENFFKRWDWILDEMIWAFNQKCRDDWESDYYRYEPDTDEQFGLKLVWSDDANRQAHQERMSNGFRLFGKYYEALWD